MFSSKSFIKQTSINESGGIRVSIYKQVYDGDQLISEQPHQMTIGPFDDVEHIIEVNNQHLVSMGYPPVDAIEMQLPLLLRAVALDHAPVKERIVIEKKIHDDKIKADAKRDATLAELAANEKAEKEQAFKAAVAEAVATLNK